MKIAIINGPNLNLIGSREPEIYGNQSMESYINFLKENYHNHHIHYFQSNIEGEIIDEIQRLNTDFEAIIINAGAYTHTSIAIADALRSTQGIQIIEVHISNIFAREEYRKTSHIAAVAEGNISGFGLKSYALAIESLIQ